MTFETSPGCMISWSIAPSQDEARAASIATNGPMRDVASVLTALDQFSTCATVEQLLKQAVEMARDALGLNRAAIYLVESAPDRVLRGTWGTDHSGSIVDELRLSRTLREDEWTHLCGLHKTGQRWVICDRSELGTHEAIPVSGGERVVLTPLVAEGELVGVLCNEVSATDGAVDTTLQMQVAVYASVLSPLIVANRRNESIRPPSRETERGAVVRQVKRALNQNPLMSGEFLARELSISAGYLARLFKSEEGVSLVEYRNRLRIERFLRLVERGGANLYEAAIEAGFGSYAQFHRVFRRHVGTTPREYVVGCRATPSAQGASAPS